MDRRQKGYAGEELVLKNYLARGYDHLVSNFTIRGGEIDIIVENDDTTVFVEVKVINHIDDIFGYVTDKKLYFLRKAIEHYMIEQPTKPQIRLDVVFVKGDQIVEAYENVGG